MKQFTTQSGLTAATLLLSVAVQPVLAHSWVEQLMLIAANGTMTGAAGYIRGYVSRAVAGFSDDMDVYLLPPNGRSTGETILATDPLCHPSQRSSKYSTDFPMLSVSSGDYIAMRYQENGHVSLPDVNPTKPLNRGTVYIYGTAEPESEELFLDVFQKWTADGTGGNGRGRLLATRNYDDGQCYQVNSGAISTKRQTEFKKEAESPQGTDLWCQNDIQLPTDLAANSKYTLYWVWSWPTFNQAGSPTDIESPGFNITTLQYYTSCMDVSVVASSSSKKQATATVTVTEAAAGTTRAATTKSGRKTRTMTTDNTIFVTQTVQPSSTSTGGKANGAAATTAVTASASTKSSAAGSSKTIATTTTSAAEFVPTPGQTFSVQPFLNVSTTAATTFKRVRRH
ncbi:hypothetical protein F503_03498 [Ophiostoma piceae UAMH 11346]|uniref:DUF7492 domain-containing protein n=1 Tax=Ophiostoma piceae (strain UAMH 11346) TaxID=1262450 RepID=S3C5E5_OPHP1|nr:hypothetical protein F503_03498 [Ophiostoma piceae UAMH 11346]